MDRILIKGAREHNLKDFDLEIPRKRLVVVTGVSGSGKSSLAFDTIYAEGQRRYVESLSVYARQFLEQMDKPDVESIEGLSPAISIEQKTVSHNPRSTVGTVTEVYDHLRLLFARVGRPHCPNCGKAITSQSVQQMVDRVMCLPAGSRIELTAPIVRNRKGEYRKDMERLVRDGYTRLKVDGVMRDLGREAVTLDKRKKHTIEAIIDRLIVRDGIASRLADSMEAASRLSGGVVKVEREGGGELIFNERLACVDCAVGYEDITPAFFSFNSPEGACPECKGLGERLYFDPDLVVPDRGLSLEDGAIAPWSRRSTRLRHILDALSREYGLSLSLPFERLPEGMQDIVLQGSKGRPMDFSYERGGKKYVFTEEFEGVLPNLERCYLEAQSPEEKEELHRYMNSQPCPACRGSRLKREALFIKIGDRSIHDIAAMSVSEAAALFSGIRLSPQEEAVAQRILKEIRERLGFLSNVGLGYVSLDRRASTLSGGEGQRIRLATQIGSNLSGVLYVLDEPTIGLHQQDNRRLIEALKRLVAMGNTVLVVEHDEETIREADFVVDMGPGAGELGGEIVALGAPSEVMRNPSSLTGKYLSGEMEIPVPAERKRPGRRFLCIKGASANNLKHIEARFPIGLMTCVTGVSGSGKSTLVVDTLYRNLARTLHGDRDRAGHVASISGVEHIDKVIDIDQSPIGRTPRSNPATYTGLFAPIRELFSGLPEARVRGYGPGRFSFNVKGGRCEKCAGEGVITVEMHFLPDVHVPCDECAKKRYNRETLEVRYKGSTIADCLDMTVTEAQGFFENIPSVAERLGVLSEVGLGYIRLGQSAATLSGGEAQRMKLARELSRRATGRTLYILDEPTTGLHFADIEKLLHVLASLRDAGNTIVIIEHNLDVIKCADHVIDLGPGGGEAGGRIIAEGTPEDVASTKGSATGEHLKRTLQRHNGSPAFLIA